MNPSQKTLAALRRIRCVAAWLLVTALLPVFVSAQQLEIAFDTASPKAAELGVQGSIFSASNPITTDSAGNIYVSLENGPSIVRAAPTGETSIAFSATEFLEDYALANPDASLPQIESIRDLIVDDLGTLFLATVPEHNILAVSPNGSVEIILNGLAEDDGEFLYQKKILALNPDGYLFLVGLTSDRVYQITGDDPLSLLVDLDLVFESEYETIRSFVFAPDGSAVLTTFNGIYAVEENGSAKLILQNEGTDPLSRFSYGILPETVVDAFGNFYFWSGHYGPGYFLNSYNIADQISLDGDNVMLLATESGDGTGFGDCFDFHDGQYVCRQWYGNYIPRIESMFIDSAQNLFVITYLADHGVYEYGLWKLSPDGVFQPIATDLSSLGGHIGHVEGAAFSEQGALYLADEWQNLILRISPLPTGSGNEFMFNEPHTQLAHSREGVESIPAGYAVMQQSQNSNLSGQTAHLDTRNPPLAHIDWTTASRDSSVIDFEGDFAEFTRETVINATQSYTRETITTTRATDSLKLVRSINYLVNSEEVLSASGLRLPESILRSFPHAKAMRWLLNGNNVIEGGNLNDVIQGYAGHDVLYGWAGDDLMYNGPGAEIFYGGEGHDIVSFDLPREYYHLSRDPVDGSTTVKVKVGQGDPYVDWLSSDVEQIEFADGIIATSTLSYFGEARALSSDAIELPDTESAVYRFFNTRSQAFFYTPFLDERDQVIRNSGPSNEEMVDWPFVYQGAKFRAAHSYDGQRPLYRFYNTRTGHHFFTVNETERALVLDRIASGEWSFVYEGVAFSVYPWDPNPSVEGQETPVYRFFNPILGRHAFTASHNEAEKFRQSADWRDEGIGFWAESL